MNLGNFCLWFSANVLEALPTRGSSRTEVSPGRGLLWESPRRVERGLRGAPYPHRASSAGGAGTCRAGRGGTRAVNTAPPGASCRGRNKFSSDCRRPPVNFQSSQKGDPLRVRQRPRRPRGGTSRRVLEVVLSPTCLPLHLVVPASQRQGEPPAH